MLPSNILLLNNLNDINIKIQPKTIQEQVADQKRTEAGKPAGVSDEVETAAVTTYCNRESSCNNQLQQRHQL